MPTTDTTQLLGRGDPASFSGLTSAEATRRLHELGPNDLVPEANPVSIWAWIVKLASDPMALLLLATAATYVALGDRLDAIVVSIALLTGESIPVDKSATGADGEATKLYAGTTVFAGGGVVVVTGRETQYGRSGGLLAEMQCLVVLVERSPGRPLWHGLRSNTALLVALPVTLALLPVAVTAPGLNAALHFAPLPPSIWGEAVLIAIAATLWYEPFKVAHR